MKLHRLGRTSFRAVKSKRDYLRHRNSYNWLYLSRLAALKEFAFMKALEEHGFPVPNAVDCNRHCVLMSLVPGYPLVQVKQLQHPKQTFNIIIGLIVRLAEHGLIHCDFNEFNIMIDDEENVTMIDFPQMVSVSHRNAQMYFDRDVDCIFKFFEKRFATSAAEGSDVLEESDSDSDDDRRPCFEAIAKSADSLDKALAASGFTEQNQDDLEKFVFGKADSNDAPSSDIEDDAEGESFSQETVLGGEKASCLETQESISQEPLPGGENASHLKTISVDVNGDCAEVSDHGDNVDSCSASDRVAAISLSNGCNMDQQISAQDTSIQSSTAGDPSLSWRVDWNVLEI